MLYEMARAKIGSFPLYPPVKFGATISREDIRGKIHGGYDGKSLR